MQSENNKLIQLYNLLNNKSYYSLEINHTAKKTGLSVDYLRSLAQITKSANSQLFYQMTCDEINIFKYNNVEYIGLETRRLAYELDKALGCNWVEEAIKNGKYK